MIGQNILRVANGGNEVTRETNGHHADAAEKDQKRHPASRSGPERWSKDGSQSTAWNFHRRLKDKVCQSPADDGRDRIRKPRDKSPRREDASLQIGQDLGLPDGLVRCVDEWRKETAQKHHRHPNGNATPEGQQDGVEKTADEPAEQNAMHAFLNPPHALITTPPITIPMAPANSTLPERDTILRGARQDHWRKDGETDSRKQVPNKKNKLQAKQAWAGKNIFESEGGFF